jgi:predicted nucleotidyltransferase
VDFVEPVSSLFPGVVGRVVTVLLNTSVPLSGRAIAELADVSPAQASRVLPRLAELGLVEAVPSPPAVLYSIVEDHVAFEPLQALSLPIQPVVDRLRRRISGLDPRPTRVVAYGSFARRAARADSDIDLLVVRPVDPSPPDEAWEASIDSIRSYARRLSGNRIDILEVTESELAELVSSGRPLWEDIARDALVVHGPPLTNQYDS